MLRSSSSPDPSSDAGLEMERLPIGRVKSMVASPASDSTPEDLRLATLLRRLALTGEPDSCIAPTARVRSMVSSPMDERAIDERLRFDCENPGDPASVVDLRLFCPLRIGDAAVISLLMRPTACVKSIVPSSSIGELACSAALASRIPPTTLVTSMLISSSSSSAIVEYRGLSIPATDAWNAGENGLTFSWSMAAECKGSSSSSA